MKEFAEYLNDRFPKTRQQLERETGLEDRKVRKAISAAITKLVENVINKCMDKPWKAYILSVEDGVYFVSGGASQGIETGDEFAVMQKGKQVKNPQTGLMIELPGKVVGKIRIEQTLGDTPQDEVAMASLVEGTIDANALDKYYVTELKKD